MNDDSLDDTNPVSLPRGAAMELGAHINPRSLGVKDKLNPIDNVGTKLEIALLDVVTLDAKQAIKAEDLGYNQLVERGPVDFDKFEG